MTDLLPCPFCSLPDGKLERYGPRSGWHVVCVYCTAQGPNHGSKEEAVSSWNMRRIPKKGMGGLTAATFDPTNNGVGMDHNGKIWLEHPSNMPGLPSIFKDKPVDGESE